MLLLSCSFGVYWPKLQKRPVLIITMHHHPCESSLKHGCGAIRFGEYGLHDLVVLDQQTMGVIVQIHANSCKVLTNQVLCRYLEAPWLQLCVKLCVMLTKLQSVSRLPYTCARCGRRKGPSDHGSEGSTNFALNNDYERPMHPLPIIVHCMP